MTDTDTVTLQQAMADAGTADVGLLGHAITHAAPGFPGFTDGLWETLDRVGCGQGRRCKQHVHWHTDPAYTEHALPWGRERITHGPHLDDPVVNETRPDHEA